MARAEPLHCFLTPQTKKLGAHNPITSPKCPPTDPYRFWTKAGPPHSSLWYHNLPSYKWVLKSHDQPSRSESTGVKTHSSQEKQSRKFLGPTQRRGRGEDELGRSPYVLEQKALMFHRRGEESSERCKAQSRLGELLQLLLQHKSLPKRSMCSCRRDRKTSPLS